jgi:putative ABC transport system permease protein
MRLSESERCHPTRRHHEVRNQTRTGRLTLALELQSRGAERRDIHHGMVLAEGMRLSGWGVGIGILAALVAGRFLAHLLYGVGAADPASFLAVWVLLILVGLAAGYLPARRAARIDPIEALRQD